LIGRKRPATGWPAGLYRAQYRVLNAGKTVFESSFSARIGPEPRSAATTERPWHVPRPVMPLEAKIKHFAAPCAILTDITMRSAAIPCFSRDGHAIHPEMQGKGRIAASCYPARWRRRQWPPSLAPGIPVPPLKRFIF